MAPLRLSLTISGAVALGAYEGGALAALLHATRPLVGGDVPLLAIDVMSGASAGSITALLAARALLEGHDPVAVMSGAWVERDSLGALLAHGSDAPLSIEALRDTARDLLDPPGTPDPRRQAHPVRLSYALAVLRGLDYRLPRLGREPIAASTSVDFFDHTLAPAEPIDGLVSPAGASPLDAALASAANAMGFPPYLLDRSAVWAQYLAAGVDNLPPDPDRSLWYTDGGTLDNEPLGRTLDLANEADAAPGGGQAGRLHLLIHPHPTAAVRDRAWADPDRQPTFVQSAVRAFGLQRAQSIYADLKHLEKTNTRITWLDRLAGELGPVLENLSPADRARVDEALERALASMRDDAAVLRAQRLGTEAPAPAPGERRDGEVAPTLAPLGDRFREALAKVAGVGGKRPARADVISPLLLPASASHPVEEILSGETLFHFGGFLDEEMRRNDFDVGYASTLAWLTAGGLAEAGLDAAASDEAVAAATTAYVPGEGWRRTGRTTVGSLLRMHPWQAARVTAKFAEVLLHDALHHERP